MRLMEAGHDRGAYWQRTARRFARRYNRARWLAITVPGFAAINLVFGLVAVLFRVASWPQAVLWGLYASAFAALAVTGWVLMRRGRFTAEETMARLDACLRLNNRLSAAAAGVGGWPAPRSDIRDGLAWDWRRVGAVPALSVAVLALLAAIPLAPGSTGPVPAPQEPLAWSQMEQWIDTLRDAQAADEEALDRWLQQIEALRNRPKAEWYSHSSIEAGDTLKEALEGSIQSLSRDLESVAQTLAQMGEVAGRMSAADWEKLAKQIQVSSRLLEAGNLPIDPALLSRLQRMAELELRHLSAAELASLCTGVCDSWAACSGCLGKEGGDLAALLAGMQPGRGGVNRGRGDAPLTLAEEETRLESDATEALPQGDLERAGVGDLVRVGTTNPEVAEDAPTGPIAGGGLQSRGAGGETVWRNPMTPEERTILERYFR